MLTASFSAQDPEAGLVYSSSSAVIELMIRFFCFWHKADIQRCPLTLAMCGPTRLAGETRIARFFDCLPDIATSTLTRWAEGRPRTAGMVDRGS
jgi:hypothetical protein